jgi:secretion/DNA translocation related TadE-like protein
MTRQRRDDGSATVIVLAAGLVTVLLALASAAVGAAIEARHRAQAAADAAALAAAGWAVYGESIACAQASRVAAANNAEMVHCGLIGWDALVTVSVRPAGPAAVEGSATASARAGPA